MLVEAFLVLRNKISANQQKWKRSFAVRNLWSPSSRSYVIWGHWMGTGYKSSRQSETVYGVLSSKDDEPNMLHENVFVSIFVFSIWWRRNRRRNRKEKRGSACRKLQVWGPGVWKIMTFWGAFSHSVMDSTSFRSTIWVTASMAGMVRVTQNRSQLWASGMVETPECQASLDVLWSLVLCVHCTAVYGHLSYQHSMT